MSKSIRIRTTPLGDDKYLKVKIDQDFDFLEILSLKISQTEAYKKYCSDYGVVVGRVVVNSGFGIPNAKVSIFIPLSEEDKDNPIISGLYPFESVYSKDSNGIRYNLLPKELKREDRCFVPVGTFPSKREVLDCDTTLEIFEKYYKFTTTTNQSGDFMIFGVPVGEHTIHVDADLSDIGYISQKPYELISVGYSRNLFSNEFQFKKSTNLDVLSQIKSRNSNVNVSPFWGDLDECQVGITRIDFDLNYNITPTAVFMGSIFTDDEKNSINKNCRPRRAMGRLCDTITGEGNIEIIRKTEDGLVESISVEGDRLINSDGVWCFQIPMNLDKVVTDEFGNLIPSEDPDKGIARSAKVRFRIGLDETGSEGRLRTRAKFLVPNRTNNYDFDESTPDEEFADIRWKKMYTIRQFIARYQKNCGLFCGTKRSFIGVKDVDNCGDHTHFPYNKIDTNFNPLFNIYCLLFSYFLFFVELINLFLISIINSIIGILNSILCLICNVIWLIAQLVDAIVQAANQIPGVSIDFDPCEWCIGSDCCDCNNVIKTYLPCVVFTCQEERYAPGCYKPDDDCAGSTGLCLPPLQVALYGWCAANENAPLDHWPDDGHCLPDNQACGSQAGGCHGCCGPIGIGGLIPYAGFMNCFELELASALNLFRFDFYNDWINGTLYAFLIKYKVRRQRNNDKTREMFCDYDCAPDYAPAFQSTGTNQIATNNFCGSNRYLVDTCALDVPVNILGTEGTSDFKYLANKIREGVVKEYKDELYYAAYNHDKRFILYATDISCLGSLVDCDIDGQEKFVEFLTPTTYQLPPEATEFADGQDENDSNTIETTGIDPLLVDINCFRPKVSPSNCENLKYICEIGIGLDEDRTPDVGGEPANCQIKIFLPGQELENEFIRNVIGKCSTGNPDYDCRDEDQYNQFRGDGEYSLNDMYLPQYNSYYYYFGIRPGKTALDCVNSKYFGNCRTDRDNLLPATINVTDNICPTVGTSAANQGSIDLTLLGGVQPYTYSLINNAGTLITSATTTNNTINFVNLFSDSYQITITDSNNDVSVYDVTVGGATPLSVIINNIVNATSSTNTNGSINVNVNGGIPPYTYQWSNGATTQDISGLAVGTYTLIVTDSGTSSGLGCAQGVATISATISTPPPLNFAYNSTNILCNGNNDGKITITGITGGTRPYTIFVNGTLTQSYTLTNLPAGTYTINVYDATSANTGTQVVTITQPPALSATYGFTPSTPPVCGSCLSRVTVTPSGGVSPYTYSWNNPGSAITTATADLEDGTYRCIIKDSNGCTFTLSNIVVPEILATRSYNSLTQTLTITPTLGPGPFTINLINCSNNTVQTISGVALNTPTNFGGVLPIGINGSLIQYNIQVIANNSAQWCSGTFTLY